MITPPSISQPELLFAQTANANATLEHDRLSYLEQGKPARGSVVLLHGIGSNATAWRHLLPLLSPEYRVVVWNAPGYYLSSSLRAEAPAHGDYAEVLEQLLDALGLEQVHLVGSSFGSMIAASFAAFHPGRVRSLVLLGATRGHKHLPAEQRARLLAARASAIEGGPLKFAATRFEQLIAPGARAEVVAEVRQVLSAVCPRGFMQAARAVSQTDVVDFAPRIRAPTVVAVGTADVVNPPDVSRTIQSAISRSRLATLDGVGHLSKIEAPHRVYEILREHLLHT